MVFKERFYLPSMIKWARNGIFKKWKKEGSKEGNKEEEENGQIFPHNWTSHCLQCLHIIRVSFQLSYVMLPTQLSANEPQQAVEYLSTVWPSSRSFWLCSFFYSNLESEAKDGRWLFLSPPFSLHVIPVVKQTFFRKYEKIYMPLKIKWSVLINI